jgi:type I restriction enzyme S subunit
MPQISYIKYKDILEARRFDAEYFRPFILKLISKIESGKFSRIGKEFDVTKLAGFEYTKYFTKHNIESDDFYIALTSLNIQNENLVDEGALKIDRKIANDFLSRSKLYYGDVVLSYTGEYRRSLTILDKD